MPYIPLYPQSLHRFSPPSIWSPNQSHNVGLSEPVWPRMPTSLLNNHAGPLPASFMSRQSSRSAASPKVSVDRQSEDVFGPIMSNDRATNQHILASKKDVGAIGDRRKKEDAHIVTGDVCEMSDSRSAFAVEQLLRNLNMTPLPAAPLLHHPKANRATHFPLYESPSASSNSSSPGVADILQTPSDNSPIAPRSPQDFGLYADVTKLTPSNAKMGSIYAFENHGNVHNVHFSDDATKHPAPAVCRGLTPAPLNASNSFSGPQSTSLTSSGNPFCAHSFPLVEKLSTPPGLHHPAFSRTSPSNLYKGAFNPFASDFSSGSGPGLLQTNILKSKDNVDPGTPWPPNHQAQARSCTYANAHEQWPPTQPSQSHSYATETTPPVLVGPVQRRSSLEPPQTRLSEDTGFTSGDQGLVEPHYRHLSLSAGGITGAGFNFTQHDMMNGLRITGLDAVNGERNKLRLGLVDDHSLVPSPVHTNAGSMAYSCGPVSDRQQGNEPINFLHLLSPTAAPPYSHFITRIVKSSDQQASIFLQQKLKIADTAERRKIIDAVSQRGVEMMTNRFGNWAVQRCLEPPCETADRMKIVNCMRGRVVELATNCYGTHVLQKALDCEEEVRLLIVSELLLGDPSSTLLNKHSAHVWSKIMELTWTPPAPPIFSYVNKSLAGKWASLACHETGSLVVQTAFEQCEDTDKELIIGELLDEEAFGEVVTNAWVLEHGSPPHRSRAINNLINGLSQYASHEQSIKSVLKALKEGGPEVLDRIVARLCEAPKGGRRASLVDIALSPIGSQLIGTILPNVNKEQRSALYEAIRGHVVTLRGSRVGSKVIWLFDRMRAYYGY